MNKNRLKWTACALAAIVGFTGTGIEAEATGNVGSVLPSAGIEFSLQDEEKSTALSALKEESDKEAAEQQEEIRTSLAACVYDDYDKLIQLCDALAGAEGVVSMEERMTDIKRRYGSYPQEKWDKNMALKDYFSVKAGKDIYEIVGYQES